MAKFVELTNENGTKRFVNFDLVISFSPIGGQVDRGTALSFGYAAGDKLATRVVRVVETCPEVLALLD